MFFFLSPLIEELTQVPKRPIVKCISAINQTTLKYGEAWKYQHHTMYIAFPEHKSILQ